MEPYNRKQMHGLGDKIDFVARKTGIKRLVKAINKDCGCEERKSRLNYLHPNRRVRMGMVEKKEWAEIKEYAAAVIRSRGTGRRDVLLKLAYVHSVVFAHENYTPNPHIKIHEYKKMFDDLKEVYSN